jgi:hypothetical protein
MTGRRSFIRVLTFAGAGLLWSIAANAAHAEGCTQSREYILNGLAGDLAETPQSYQSLFKTCLATTELSNIKDAFLLRDGGIGAIPKRDDVGATAQTLSEFCQRFPQATLRFITRSDQKRVKTMGQTVLLSSTGVTPCKKIRGLM